MELTPLPLRSMIPVTVPRGYHFHPTDEQLISYYLKLKVEGKPIPAIPDLATEEVELYGPSQSKEPWELFRELSTPNVSFYVFSKLETTSPSSKKIKRVAGRGTWDLQNTHEVLRSDDPNKTVIGLKRMFRFEMKRAKDKVPRWIMHEYTLSGVPNYALCEIKHIVSDKEMADHQDRRGSDIDLDLGDYLERNNKRSGSVCVNGDGRGKRVRVDGPATDSNLVPPTQGQGALPLPLTNGGAEQLPDRVLNNIPEEPLPLLGNGDDGCGDYDWIVDDTIDIEDLLSLPESAIDDGLLPSSIDADMDPTTFVFDTLPCSAPSLSIPCDLQQQQGVCQ